MARMLLSRQLAGEGHEVTEAVSGEEALEKLSESEFDLLILDETLQSRYGFPIPKLMASLKSCFSRDFLQLSQIGEQIH